MKQKKELTKEEMMAYINDYSRDIFQKPFDKLELGERVTLRCNLIVRLRLDQSKSRSITENEYKQLLEEIPI
jgi:hypothetical protein